MPLPKAIVFDLDQTLSASKVNISPAMAGRLTALLSRIPVAITSGQKFERLLEQVAAFLPTEALANLYLLPTSGAALFTFDGAGWRPVYEERISDDEARRIISIVEKAGREHGIIDDAQQTWGPRLEHRMNEVAYSGLGQNAPIGPKEAFDPDRARRRAFRDVLIPLLPGYEVRVAGATTIDITKEGIDKAFGLRNLATHLGIPIPDMLYIGDDLGPGGNDEVVIQTGIPTRAVRDPDDTAAYLDGLLGETP
ncbi:HAD-IIB family hydrolase [Patescibacteria group bacterium]|nr:HAD-IIB family hydrolase [Patescibacteria group bacterium]